MKVLKVDVVKRDELNVRIKEFTSLQSELQFKERYEDKLKNILMSSSAKLVGCNAKIKINPRAVDASRYSNTEYVLTRSGIKESFGYDGSFKARFMSGSHWIHDYVKEEAATIGLVKLLKSKELQFADGLRLHLQARQDISKLELDNERYTKHIKNKLVLPIYGNIEDGANDNKEETSELVLSTSQGYASKNIDFVVPGTVKKLSRQYYGEELEGNTIVSFSGHFSFIEYLRISEEPTYSELMRLLAEEIVKCKKYIAIKSTEAEAVLTKYGQYLVFNEL